MTEHNQELIWRGRLHVGDGPGTYGDATFVGLRADLPVTVDRFDEGRSGSGSNKLWFTIRGEDVKTLRGYEGHLVSVVLFSQSRGGDEWVEKEVGSGRLKSATEEVSVDGDDFDGQRGPHYLSVRVGVDTAVGPGLYDDFVLVALTMRSGRYYASFGFTTE